MMKLKYNSYKSIKSYLSIGYIALIFISCANENKSSREHLVFRYNEHSNIASLDPAFAKNQADIWATNQLFNGLVQLDDSLNIQPDIAKDWFISGDALTYTFTLRKGVFFHKHNLFGKDSTRQVNAHDFEYSFGRLLDPQVASPGRWVMNYVENFKALNDTVFSIQLKQPFPAFLGLLTTKYCSVVPKEIVEATGNKFRSHPIGTGPFKFKLWEENTKLVFRKNELYYEKDSEGNALPYLEAVAITFLPDKQSEFLQFVQGNIDFLNSLDASYKDELLTTDGKLQAKYRSRFNMATTPFLNTEYLGFFLESNMPEIQSGAIRKAINYGFDRKKMITYLRNGIGTPALNGFIPKGLPGFTNIEGYNYQPEKAKKLIEQFKKETGINQPEITITTDANYLDLCEYIQREIEKTGLKVNIDVVPPATLRQSKATGKLDAFRASWIADYPDAENYLSLYYSKNFAPNGPNYTHFKNLQFDTWYETASREVNNEKRYRLYEKMDSLIISQAPIIPLYYDQAIRFTKKNVHGLESNPANILSLKRVKKIKGL
ncbi:ABC transporter substrate-binding protein [Leptobacterium sp. I13]|uniref:ABC transporter substrate-binding protein n=1 Tax=Leptobacterium meishanense TaxID=3128904 RepID=UPI0030ED7A09